VRVSELKQMLAPQQFDPLEDIEADLLLEGIFRQYGFDFRNYARSSLKRRIRNFLRDERIGSISLLQDRLLHDSAWMDRFVYSLSVNVSAMFRDPNFYIIFRNQVVPLLRTYPFIRIWLAGVSMGEEVYSLAILLQEEGMYERCRIYATDINEAVLKKAKEGIYAAELVQTYADNYTKAGGKRSFSDYYAAAYESIIMKSALRNNIVFAQHNLATDASFNEFHVILCRNVMIYFNKELQAHVYNLLHESLVTFGVLGLGAKETLKFSPHEYAYEEIDKTARLYRRVA
jgi:chemotaxis protein methyltransferase CheR